MRFSKVCYLLGALGSLAFTSAKSVVFTYNNKADKPAQIEKFDDFQSILYDKLEIDDLVYVDENSFNELEHIDTSEYLLTQQDVKKGHLIIVVEEDGTSEYLKEKFSESSIHPLFEIDDNEYLKERQLLLLLMSKERELKVKINTCNFKFISNDHESHQVAHLNALLKLNKKSQVTRNDESLIHLKFAIDNIFPRQSFYSYSSSDTDVKYATLRVQVDRSEDSIAVESIENNMIELVKQASYHGIESTIILTTGEVSTTGISANNNNSKYYSEIKRSATKKASKEGPFSSEEECILSTNNCNTHGLCSKNSLSGAWACICSSTFNKTSKSTTQWSGSSCNKIDVSTEFNLLFWSSLVMVITVFASIALVFKMDSEPLPGLLAASTSPSFKN